jgi:hypothetical protein
VVRAGRGAEKQGSIKECHSRLGRESNFGSVKIELKYSILKNFLFQTPDLVVRLESPKYHINKAISENHSQKSD